MNREISKKKEDQVDKEAFCKHSVELRSSHHQPSKAELNDLLHLPGRSPEDVAKIVTQGGAPRHEPEKTDS